LAASEPFSEPDENQPKGRAAYACDLARRAVSADPVAVPRAEGYLGAPDNERSATWRRIAAGGGRSVRIMHAIS
jgi:hypothetical protein